MRQLPGGSYDAIMTDPPYASGGLTTAERKASPVRKYISRNKHPSFDFDTRDQRSHFMWSVLWMAEALRLTREGGWLMVCSDWRQLPTTSDALQVAGWTWRSVVTWDKTEACRPHQGMFRNQAEFVLVAPRQHRQRAGPSARVPGRRLPSLPQARRQAPPHGQARSSDGPPDDGSVSRLRHPGPVCRQRHHDRGRPAAGTYGSWR